MLGNNQDIERMDAYLEGRLSKEEMSAFDARLNSDVEFKEAFDIHLAFIAGMQSHGRKKLKEEFAAIHGKIDGDFKEYEAGSHSSKDKKSKPKKGGGASGLKIILIGLLGRRSNRGEYH